MSKADDLELARSLGRRGEILEAFKIVDRYLTDEPNDVDNLICMAWLMIRSGKAAVAYHLLKQLVRIEPRAPNVWLNLGKCAAELNLFDESERVYKKGLGLTLSDEDRANFLSNLSGLMLDKQDFARAGDYARAVIEFMPDSHTARSNLGFSQLAAGNWAEGWKNYRYSIGTAPFRRLADYNSAPLWDGTKGQKLVVYGEQGIGDEVAFASMIPDVCEDAEVIIDCAPKLERLFRRSFPKAKVYGTNGVKNSPWDVEDTTPDYVIPIGQLGEFYRTSIDQFPGWPYLVADPIKVKQWSALWKDEPKPVIGLAWRGGLPRTGAKFRQVELEQFMPLFDAVDAHWVSLQYKRADREIERFHVEHPEVDIVEYPHATLTPDYDDTAGLVASLDAIVSVPTAVWHLAGGLGTPVFAMKAQQGCWKTQSGLPFHPVHKFIDWQGSWDDTVEATVPHVLEFFSNDQQVRFG